MKKKALFEFESEVCFPVFDHRIASHRIDDAAAEMNKKQRKRRGRECTPPPHFYVLSAVRIVPRLGPQITHSSFNTRKK